jgi:YD repeat-containing protein
MQSRKFRGGVVIKKLVLVLVVVFFWHCIAIPNAHAQNANPGVATTLWYFPDPIPFGWWDYGPGQGPYSYVIAAYTTASPPPPGSSCNASSSGGAPGGTPGGAPGGTPGAFCGAPISLSSGDTLIGETDFSLPGLGGGLTLRRTWNSLWPANQLASSIGIFGPNWRSTYEERIFMGGDNRVTYARADGGYWSFGLNGAGVFVVSSPANVSATLSQNSSYLVLKFQNGEQRQFNLTTGLLTAIIDRNGNATQLTYDSSNRLVTVTSPASQHLYFNYQSSSSFLIASVTSDFGVAFSYSYDAQGRLSQVTKPDQTTVTYTYNAQAQITQVTDSNGKVLESHTYDSSGRGLTSSQANGVNAVTLTYP